MSEGFLDNLARVPPRVIARAFNDEPVVLFALEMQPNGHHVNVSREFPPPSYIGWPLNDAFDYDIDDFQRLWDTYSRGDKAALEEMYHEMRQRQRVFVTALTAGPAGGTGGI